MSLQKFIDAQARGPDIGHGATWNTAINQLRRMGAKGSLHYAWYIFPQLAGVAQMVTGHDPTAISRYYAINNLEQAVAYLRNGDLRNRLMIFATEMAHIAPHRPIGAILGIGDALKFKSSMTLFLIAALIRRDDNALTTFRNALLRFGAPRLYDNLDPVTLTILREQNSPLLAGVPSGVFSMIDQDDGGGGADDGGGAGGGDPSPDAAADSFYTPPWSPSESPRGPRAPRGFDGDAAQEELIDTFDMGEGGSLIDQIVAMGFSAHDAAMALARAEPPGNIPAAIQLLLAEQREIPDDPPPAAPLSLIDQIVAMGFSAHDAAMALARAEPPGNIPAAIQLLLDDQREIPADPPAVAPARRRRQIGRLPSDVQGSSRRPRIARSKTRAKRWPKVQTGQSGSGRRTQRRKRRRRRYSRKKRQRGYRKRKTRGRRKTRRRNK